MQKEFIILFFLIAFIIVGDCITQNYTNKNLDILENDLRDLKNYLASEDKELSNEKMENINSFWLDIQEKLSLYIEHTELDRLETSITLCSSFTETENYDLAITELEKSIFISEHIKDKYSFTLKNIL